MSTLDNHFEKFTYGPPQSRQQFEEPRVTINSRGHIYMNTHTYERLGRPKYVTLYYSRVEDAIAVEPVFPPTHASFRVLKKVKGWAVHAAHLCSHHRLRVPTTIRFTAPTLNNGILVLHLRNTVPVARPRKNRPGAI